MVVSANPDPLRDLLQRYRAERKAFDETDVPNEDFDRLASSTWFRTQNEIISVEPPTTTAVGALLALDHVLESDELFGDRFEWDDQQLLWLLVRAVRDYIQSHCLT